MTAPALRPSVGRIVHYVLPAGRSEGQVRPAIVTQVFANDAINAFVVLDGINDRGQNTHAYTAAHSAEPKPGTWHWPPRV